MSLAVPLALLALAAVPLVVALHFVAARWRSREVSSLALWEEALREVRTSLRVRRLLRIFALAAEVLAVGALAVALAGPSALRPTGSAGDTVLVLDVTASMQARDGRGSRWDEAREQALQLVSSLGRGARMAIVEAGRGPRVLAPFTADRRLLAQAVAAAAATDEAGDPAASLLFALGLRERGRATQVVFVTDGAFDSLGAADPALPQVASGGHAVTGVRVIEVGGAADNVGITALQYRRDATGTRELFVAIENATERRVTVPLAVSAAAGGRAILQRDVTVEARATLPIGIPLPEGVEGRVTARITTGDSLAVDDQAFALVAQARTLRVLLVGGDPFLRAALSGFPGLHLEEAAGIDPATGVADPEQWDLVAIEGVPAPPLEQGRYLLFGTVAPGLPLAATGTTGNPRFQSWDRSHPVLAGLALSPVVIGRALRVSPGPGVRVLARSSDGPLAATWEREGLQVLFFAFQPADSDLPLRPAFPLMVAQALAWFHPDLFGGEAAQVHPGESVDIPVPAGTTTVAVTTPDGRTSSGQPSGASFLYSDTFRTGFYQVEAGGERRELAVSLCDAAESDTRQRYTSPADSSPAAPGGEAPGPVGSAAGGTTPEPLWPILALVAFLLVAAEGALWVFQRGPLRQRPTGGAR